MLWLIYLQNITNRCLFVTLAPFLLLLFPFLGGCPTSNSFWSVAHASALASIKVCCPTIRDTNMCPSWRRCLSTQTCARAEGDVYPHKHVPALKAMPVHTNMCPRWRRCLSTQTCARAEGDVCPHKPLKPKEVRIKIKLSPSQAVEAYRIVRC
jgi:hypothetical protein